MSKMELVREYIREYIKENDITGDDVHRLYNEAWEVCRDSISCSKSIFIMYMMD